MGKVMTSISMSLDGFIAGPNDDIQQLFGWYFGGDVAIPVQGGRMTLRLTPESAGVLQAEMENTAVMLAGRRMFDLAGAWGGHPPYEPCVIVTHHPPQEWVKDGSPFVFVTDGIESAVQQAQALAGDKNIAVATPSVTQQCLKAGLLDEIRIDLVPVLLGQGIRLFEYLGIEPVALQQIRAVQAPGVTHLAYRVVKPDDEGETHNLVVTRLFSAPAEQVWRAWSESDLVMRWWGPVGFTAPLARMDFREGGTSLVCMRAPAEFGGQDMYNTWTYTRIVPHQEIEFIQHFTDQDGTPVDPAEIGLPAGIPAEVRHVVTFRPAEDGRTELTVTEFGYTSAAAAGLSKMGMEQCLDKMGSIFA